MNRLYTILATILIGVVASAQAPSKLSYQAVIRNSNNQLVASQTIGVRISIIQGAANGTQVYSETITPKTNANGLMSVEIGSNAGFEAISWADGPFFVKTETDPTGGSNYTITGTSQLLSVPYALHAKTAETIKGGITEMDPVFDASAAKEITSDEIEKWNLAHGWGDHASQGYLKSSTLVQKDNLFTYDGTNWVAKKLVLGIAGGSQAFDNLQPYLALNYCIALLGIFPSRNSMDPFIGEIELFAFNFEPRDYAFCDGRIMSVSENSALFYLLYNQFGGDGHTTFALPDLRGRVAINQGAGTGLMPYTFGESGGSEKVTLTIQNMPAHTHTVIYE